MDMQMAERLRRKAAGYSQEALAAELGVSRQAVSKWERGEASPDTDNLIALAGLYGVTLDELLFGKASPDPKDAGEKDENPAKSQVRISLREGIHVVDPKGEEVHVGWDGIHASDAAGNTVESDPEGEGVTINGTHYDSWHDAHEELGHDLKGKSDFRRRWDAFPFPALVLVAYLAVGWATGQWVVALLLGYLVPLYYGGRGTGRRGTILTGQRGMAAPGNGLLRLAGHLLRPLGQRLAGLSDHPAGMHRLRQPGQVVEAPQVATALAPLPSQGVQDEVDDATRGVGRRPWTFWCSCR